MSSHPPTCEMATAERAALEVLYDTAGRVISRRELARRLGIADHNARRCDSILVGLRRALGADAIITVRSRGWMLDPRACEHVRVLLGH
jgi:DNA-binding response OmpR family regulator